MGDLLIFVIRNVEFDGTRLDGGPDRAHLPAVPQVRTDALSVLEGWAQNRDRFVAVDFDSLTSRVGRFFAVRFFRLFLASFFHVTLLCLTTPQLYGTRRCSKYRRYNCSNWTPPETTQGVGTKPLWGGEASAPEYHAPGWDTGDAGVSGPADGGLPLPGPPHRDILGCRCTPGPVRMIGLWGDLSGVVGVTLLTRLVRM